MSATLLTPPQIEPVSLSDIKAYLKIDHSEEDDLLRAFLTSARIHLEQLIGQHLITQTWRVILDCPFERVMSLPVAPLGAILSAAFLSSDGVLVDLGSEAFCINQPSGPATIRAIGGQVALAGYRLQLDVETGFGATAEEVPAPLLQAIRMITAEWYERRLIADPGSLPALSKALAPLIAPYRAVRL
ncbi:head-tail connector protein [Cohaesibacter intestini]|uniref:head-tail connector protein n=1 Tax=Cohaesibacter intestini TaxID=2211145 RepID=UPI000DEBC83E|nr:head-tail connector protein [Cohaesibacter intestini]